MRIWNYSKKKSKRYLNNQNEAFLKQKIRGQREEKKAYLISLKTKLHIKQTA
jgi:hypothetical protein